MKIPNKIDHELYIHVGLPKTATTYLQCRIFRTWENIEYLGKPFHITRLFNRLNKPLKKVLLISAENILGKPRDCYLKSKRNFSYTQMNVLALNNLGDIFPQAKIIIGFVKHEEFIESLYKQYLRGGGTKSLVEFYSPKSSTTLMNDKDFLYAPLIKTIEKCFTHSPFIYLREELKIVPSRLIADLADYMGIVPPEKIPITKENVGCGEIEAKILRIINSIHFIRNCFFEQFVKILLRLFGFKGRIWEISKIGRLFHQKQIKLSSNVQRTVQEIFKNDWKYVLDFIKSDRKLNISDI